MLNSMLDAGLIELEADGTVIINSSENKQHIMGNDKEYWFMVELYFLFKVGYLSIWVFRFP